MKKSAFLLSLLIALNVTAQIGDYNIAIKPYQVANLPGLQSFAFAKQNQYWIIIGGRLDGLHRRQPNAAFAATGNNTNIYLVNTLTNQTKSVSLNSLPTSIAEQLQSTNMEFHQHENTLYLIGGYGYSATATNHITHNKITSIDVNGLIQAIDNGTNIAPHIKQITNENMAVTGGHLGVINDTLYLVCGNRFDGRYNPMGGPSFTQAYTNQIRKFTVVNTNDTFYISSYAAITDSINLHRRDYNFTPNIDITGKEWYTVWTGVFQYNQDLPWLNTVDVSPTGHKVNNGFNQYLSQYHSANIPIFDSVNQNMYTIFLGGISQFYANENGQIVQNDSVPFVKTISYVKRDVNGNLSEHRFTTEMPGFIGAGAEFIPADELQSYHNEVLKLNSNNNDSILAGYIVGGINSSQRNIFWINTGTQSTANNTVYQVWLVKSTNTSTLKVDDANVWHVDVYPNPTHKQVSIKLPDSNKNHHIKVSLNSLTGQLIKQLYDDKYINTIHLDLPEIAKGTYYLTIQRGQLLHVEKLIVE
jgi:hypothetical protein